jgi:hypothetical protein
MNNERYHVYEDECSCKNLKKEKTNKQENIIEGELLKTAFIRLKKRRKVLGGRKVGRVELLHSPPQPPPAGPGPNSWIKSVDAFGTTVDVTMLGEVRARRYEVGTLEICGSLIEINCLLRALRFFSRCTTRVAK